MVAIALIPLIACTGMAVDVGMWRYQQQLAQTAADSGAMAAAVELQSLTALPSLYAVANIDTTANGFAGGSTNGSLDTADKVTIRVSNPPSSGPNSSNLSAVEVDVSKVLPVYFGWWSATVSARAVATAANGTCLTVLGTGLPLPISTFNLASIEMPKCGMMVNGELLVPLGTIDADAIGYSGFYLPGLAQYPQASPEEHAAVSDPCSTIAGCAYLTANRPTPAACTGSAIITAPTTLNPGTYCNTNVFGSGTVTLNAGFYYFTNGLNVNLGVNLAGTGVTLYNAGGIMNLLGTQNLVAPTSGSTANVLIFQPSSNASPMVFGAATAKETGLVYAPSSLLTLTLTPATFSDVIVGLVLMNGGSMTFPNSGNGGGLAE